MPTATTYEGSKVEKKFQHEIFIADKELRRFIKNQTTFNLGYPRMATFARDIARGTVSLPPTPDDPLLDCVGAFYFQLKQIERRVISEHYSARESMRRCAKRIGMTVSRFSRILKKLQRKCYDWLKSNGF